MIKCLHFVVLTAALFTPVSAIAKIPFDASKLGHMRGVLDQCTLVAPQKASSYLLEMKTLVGNATKDMVNEATMTDEYQQAYTSVRTELSELSGQELTNSCLSYLNTPP